MKTILSFGLYLVIFTQSLNAQGPVYNWVTKYGGTPSDREYSMALDRIGNVYMSALVNNAYSIKKVNSSGSTIWNLPVNARHLTVDSLFNVYVVGEFANTIDADPGPGVVSFTSAGSGDILISKFDGNGNLKWAKQLPGPSTDFSQWITYDRSGGVYVTGSYVTMIDVDPGAAAHTFTTTAPTRDGFLLKLDSMGNFKWARDFKGTQMTRTYAVEVDGSGKVYVTGGFQDVADLDPGPAIDTHTTSGINDEDAFICKLDTAGNFFWVKQYGNSVGSDAYQRPALGSNGHLFLTGLIYGTVDVDPGPGVLTLSTTGANDRDFFISEMDANGTLLWASKIGGTGTDWGSAIVLDSLNNIYLCGGFSSTVDFDPGPGIYTMTSAGGLYDMFIGKWSPAGAFKWVKKMSSINTEVGSFMAMDKNYNLYVLGDFNGITDFDPDAGVANLTSSGNEDVFLAKYCTTPDQPVVISGNAGLCAGSGGVFSVSALPNTQSYTWTLPLGWSGSATGLSITATAGASGVMSVVASNGCGASSASTLMIITSPTISISASATSVCVGSGATLTAVGANSYTWNSTLNGASIAVIVNTSTLYVAAGTNTAGCTNTASLQLTAQPLPVITVTTTNEILCEGESATITATGAPSITFNPGGAGFDITVTPAATTEYTVIGTGSNGCSAVVAFTQSVSSCAGVNEINTSEAGIKVYPNPGDGTLFLDTHAASSVKIQNEVGQVVYTSDFSAGIHKISGQSLSRGIYIVQVVSGGSVRHVKVVVE